MAPLLRVVRLAASASLSLLVGCLALTDTPERWPCNSSDDCQGNEICVPANASLTGSAGSVCFDPTLPCATSSDCIGNYLCDTDARRCRLPCNPSNPRCATGEICLNAFCSEPQCQDDHPEACNGGICYEGQCLEPCDLWGCHVGWTCTKTADGPRCLP